MNFAQLLIFGAAAGLGATAIFDIFLVLRQGWSATHGFYCLVGRWFGSLRHIGVFHDNIRASKPIAGEAIMGWSAHVLLGVFFGILFATLFGSSAIEVPRLWQGLGFGLATVLVPWLVFQPLLGWGIAMSKVPSPKTARLKSLVNHAIFGLGIWLSLVSLKALF